MCWRIMSGLLTVVLDLGYVLGRSKRWLYWEMSKQDGRCIEIRSM